jgi:outer membrane autotransporter protein
MLESNPRREKGKPKTLSVGASHFGSKGSGRHTAPAQFRRRLIGRITGIFAAGLFLGSMKGASGDLYLWTGGASGDFSVATNWSPIGVPGSGDFANVNGASTVYTSGQDVGTLSGGGTTFDGSLTADTIEGSPTLTGGQFQTNNFNGDVIVDGGGLMINGALITAGGTSAATTEATILVKNGGTLSSSGAFLEGGDGIGQGLTITGAGSSWSNSGVLNVGDQAGVDGLLYVSNGATVTAGATNLGTGAGASAALFVENAGSTLTTGALTAVNGGVNVMSGGSATTNGDVILDMQNAGAVGSIVTGANSLWKINGDLTVGNTGQLAVLDMSSGGLLQVEGSSIVIGAGAGSVGEIDVNGPLNAQDTSGQFTTSATSVVVGSFGSGILDVVQGSAVDLSAATVVLGDKAGSTGTLFVGQYYQLTYLGTTTLSTNDLTIGNAGTGTLTVTNVGPNSGVAAGDPETLTTEGNAIVGAQFGSNGSTATVSQPGAFWHVEQALTIGQSGQGTVTDSLGGKLQVDGALTLGDQAPGFGTFNESGAGTTASVESAVIGHLGSGVASVTAGANLVILEDTSIGQGTMVGHTGALTVSGQGTMVDARGSLTIGDAGTGTMTVNTMAQVTVGDELTVGAQAGSIGTLALDNATMTVASATGEVKIGDMGMGTMTMANGATFTAASNDVTIADESSATGTLTLSGAGTTFTSDGLTVAGTGTATMTLGTGSTVSTRGDATIADEAGSKGTVALNDTGTSWNIGGNLTIGGGGTATLVVQTNTLTVGGTQFTLGDEAGSNGKLTVDGAASVVTYTGQITIGSAGSGTVTLQDGAKIQPGSMELGELQGGSGTLTITGSGSQAQTTGEITVGAIGSGTINLSGGGKLIDNGDATLADNGVGSHGTATVATGSTWIVTGGLSDGHAGLGQITVSGASQLISDGDATIAEAGGAIGTLTVTGKVGSTASTLSYAQALIVGDGGSGQLMILLGGLVGPTTGSLVGTGKVEIAAQTASTGTVTITGTGSTLKATDVYVGGTDLAAGGTGKIVLSTTGEALIGSDLMLWQNGTVDVSGGGIVTIGQTEALRGSPTAGDFVQINPGGLLAGVGTVKGKVYNDGGLRVGDDPGTFTVEGDYEQEAGGTLNIEAEGTTQGAANGYSLFVVTGNASLAGTLEFSFLNGFRPVVGEMFDFLQVGGTTTGAFTTVTFAGLPTTDVQDTVINGVLTVTGLSVDLASPTLMPQLTPNQQAVATSLNGAVGGATGDLHTLITTINALTSAQQVAGAYDQLTPLRLGIFRNIAFDNYSFFSQQLDDHFANLRDGLTGLDTSSFSVNDSALGSSLSQIKGHLLAWQPTPEPGLLSDSADPALGGITMTSPFAPPPDRWSAFINGSVALADLDSNADNPHSSYTTGGVTLGADYRLDQHWTVGALFGYNHTDAQLDNQGSSATVDTYSPGIYAAYANKGWYANGVFTYGYNSYTENRNIIFPGIDRTAIGAPQGNQYSTDFDGGYEFHLGRLTVGPSAGLNYVHLDINDFSEGDAGAAGLNIEDQNADSLRSRIGFDARWQTSWLKTQFTYHLNASWQHEFMDNSQSITSSLETPGVMPFTVQGAGPDRDSALIDAGVDILPAKNVDLFLDYQTEAGESDFFAQSVQAGVKVGF